VADLVPTTLMNAALTHLGQPHITTPSELPGAQVLYPFVRDKLLTWARWRFATTRQRLTRLSTPPAFEWAYQYALPSVPYCLRILEASCPSTAYCIETYTNPADVSQSTRVLLTNDASVGLRYIARVPESLWPPLVADTCALWLASAMSQQVSGKASLRVQLFQELQMQLERAILLEGQQEAPRRIQMNDLYLSTRELDPIPRVDPTLPQPV
jgi:hypothetical protein